MRSSGSLKDFIHGPCVIIKSPESILESVVLVGCDVVVDSHLIFVVFEDSAEDPVGATLHHQLASGTRLAFLREHRQARSLLDHDFGVHLGVILGLTRNVFELNPRV